MVYSLTIALTSSHSIYASKITKVVFIFEDYLARHNAYKLVFATEIIFLDNPIPIPIRLQKQVIPAVPYELLDFSTTETNNHSFPSNLNKQIKIDKEQTGVTVKQKTCQNMPIIPA